MYIRISLFICAFPCVFISTHFGGKMSNIQELLRQMPRLKYSIANYETCIASGESRLASTSRKHSPAEVNAANKEQRAVSSYKRELKRLQDVLKIAEAIKVFRKRGKQLGDQQALMEQMAEKALDLLES
jgi:hypothetical protein